LLSADELSDIKQRRFGKFGVLRNALELKMLIELDRIVSGEHFGRESIKQAHLIGQLSDTLRRDTEFEVAAAFKERQQK
jgi:hypothetical protein